MVNASTILVELQVDDKGTVKVVKFGEEGEKALRKFGGAAQGVDANVGRAATSIGIMETAARSLGPVIAATFSVDALMRFSAACVTAASNLEETDNKFQVVFKGQISLAGRWAKELETNYLMSEEASKKYLASMQDLFVPMGMAADEAGRLSFQVVKLAADLGSFNNVGTEQVMMDLQSALVGNYETMKKYGVVLNETVVKAKVLELGLAKAKDEITASDKAAAALQITMESSAAAIGDVARSADSYANTSKRAAAETENLSSALGEKLLPVLTKIKAGWADASGDMARWIRNSTEDQLKSIDLQIEGLEKSIAAVEKNKGLYGIIYGDYVINKNKEQIAALRQAKEELRADLALDEGTAALLGRRTGPQLTAPETPGTKPGGSGKAKKPTYTPPSYDVFAATQRWDVQGLQAGEAAMDFAGQEAAQQAHFDKLFAMKQAHYDRDKALERSLTETHQLEASMRSSADQMALDTTINALNLVGSVMGRHHKAAFLLTKAGAIANVLVNSSNAAVAATAPPPLGLGPVFGQALAAKMLLYGKINAAIIAATAIAGQAHAGMDYVPSTGTYLLKKGERVVQPEANRELIEFLKNERGSGQKVENQYHITIDLRGAHVQDESTLRSRIRADVVEAFDTYIENGGRFRRAS